MDNQTKSFVVTIDDGFCTWEYSFERSEKSRNSNIQDIANAISKTIEATINKKTLIDSYKG